jgi:polyphosphate glucokinase
MGHNRQMATLGIDIGGSGVKGAPVDLTTGSFTDDRFRVETPQPADVPSVVRAVAEVAGKFSVTGPVGVTFPGVVVDGVVRTAANLHPSWIDAPAAELFTAAVGRPVTVLNDADAAGVAELAFGAAHAVSGTVLLLTFGTGIGSALFRDGRLVPNTEFGHVELHGRDAELHASDRARQADDLSWQAWAKRLQEYLAHVEMLLRPDLIIIGGGVSKRSEHFLPHIKLGTPIVPAMLLNHAGIVGAALTAGD